MNASFLLYALLNTVLVVLLSPFYMGLIKIVKARAQGRRGPPLLQPYYNLSKLLKKERIYSKNTSAIMRATPYINIAVMLVASLCIPLALIPTPTDGIGNVILFLYLLALAKFFMALSGLDAGSTFGGMGSSREMSISAIIEPITIIAFAALSFSLHTTDFHQMFLERAGATAFLNPGLLLIAIPLFIVLIVETSRVPVDNPETHLELTMVHEAMVLEYSGRDLALMELSHAIKQTLYMAVLINILLPWGLTSELTVAGILIAAAAFALKAGLLSFVTGLVESSMAKMRFFNLPSLFMIAFFFSILTIWLEVFG